VAWKLGLGHLSSSPASKSMQGARDPSHNHLLPHPQPPRLHRTALPPTHPLPVTALSPLMNPCNSIPRGPTPAFDFLAVPSNPHSDPAAFWWDVILRCRAGPCKVWTYSKLTCPVIIFYCVIFWDPFLFILLRFLSFVVVDLYQTPSSLFSTVFLPLSPVDFPTNFPLHSRNVHEI